MSTRTYRAGTMKEALARRWQAETPLETAARLRAQYGIVLTDKMRETLPKRVYDEMSGDDFSDVADDGVPDGRGR